MKQEVNKIKGIPGISNHLVRSKNQLRLIAKFIQKDHPNRKRNSFLTKPPNFLRCSYISALRRTISLTSDDTNTTNKAWKYHDSVITQRKRNKNEELVLLLEYTGFTIHQAYLIENQVLCESITFPISYSAAPLSSTVLKDVSYLFINHHNYIALGSRSARQFWLLSVLFPCAHEYTRRWHSSVVQNSKASAEFPSVPANSGKHVHVQRWVCLEFDFSFLAPHWQQSICKKSLQLVPGLICVEASDLGIIWEPFWHTKRYFHNYKKSAPVRHTLSAAYWESRSAW